jgi:hypothetical protein
LGVVCNWKIASEEVGMATSKDTHACPFCNLIFSYHEEVKDHILRDHPTHAAEVAAIEMRELPH